MFATKTIARFRILNYFHNIPRIISWSCWIIILIHMCVK
jgi:hypothetical protein